MNNLKDIIDPIILNDYSNGQRYFLDSGVCVYDLIIKPIVTEKALLASKNNKFYFFVNIKSTKKDIKSGLEIIYKGVKVKSINVISIPHKKRRFKGKIGNIKISAKKAIVEFDNPSLIQ